MSERQLTFKENEIIQILNRVYLYFKEGAFAPAIGELERALSIDFEYSDVVNALKCANFWLEIEQRAAAIEGDYERGEFYQSQWRVFSGFVSRMENVSERCLFSLKYHVFGKALEHFSALAGDPDNPDTEILLRIGRCHKIRGNYEGAINFLEEASRLRRDDAVILAELADCYSLVNETRAAKVFFREAFFLDSRGVELAYLESPLILRLVAKLRERFSEPEIRDWIPVYGTIYGLFNVKRELRPLELGKLKQAIFQLEKDVEAAQAAPGAPARGPSHAPGGGPGPGRQADLRAAESGVQPGQAGLRAAPVARLINHYFWLIDHYLASGEERQKIDEVLERIKAVDPVVFREYTN
jgi:tetratricopeptide (TPR) repeat protein